MYISDLPLLKHEWRVDKWGMLRFGKIGQTSPRGDCLALNQKIIKPAPLYPYIIMAQFLLPFSVPDSPAFLQTWGVRQVVVFQWAHRNCQTRNKCSPLLLFQWKVSPQPICPWISNSQPGELPMLALDTSKG